ncbi:Oidioi.mRNA.OKI2018_I69.chr2.g5785.t1.cds [Oikopleura dioica]|uniref:Oidioi.mRNA.OKI2018_I69.chr2.g5785.t1.cds n=1 Tax=Oikopleura dioica TaxID=34765 RepID=A0ABN7T722_OIKDI|nr:Oidioi.mRNA.OKI2018_I69.chr2.g5785.t1.cds [Oikopleura dioica]
MECREKIGLFALCHSKKEVSEMGTALSRQRESSSPEKYNESFDGIDAVPPANQVPIIRDESYWVSETIKVEENRLYGLFGTLTSEEVDRLRLLQREIDQLKDWI